MSLYITTVSMPIFCVNIKYFHQLTPNSVPGWSCCYQDSIRPMHNGALDEKWLQKNKFPSSLRMGTFRKFLFILYSRRPKSRLLVNQKKRGIIDQKILSSPLTVKGKIGFRNSLGFQAEIDDLRLKYRIVGGNLKIRSTERSPAFRRTRSSQCSI